LCWIYRKLPYMQDMDITLKNLLATTWQYLRTLNEAWINTPEDLLYYLPRAYEDRSQIISLRDVMLDSVCSLKGKVTKKAFITTPTGKKLAEVVFEDEHGDIGYITALNWGYLLRQVTPWSRYIIVWKPQLQWWKITLWHPELYPSAAPEKLNSLWSDVSISDVWWWSASYGDDGMVWRILPIYSELQWIKSAWFSKKIYQALPRILPHIHDALPQPLLDRYCLPSLQETLRALHAPKDIDEPSKAKTRLFFERLLHVQLLSLLAKESYQESSNALQALHLPDGEDNAPHRNIVKDLVDKLPFQLTHAQKRSIREIIEDFHRPRPMMRLLQGDVGSGKTIVAAICALYHHLMRWSQIALLAPLEVLAQQHYATLAKLLLPLWLRVELLTWSRTAKDKQSIKDALADGRIDMIVGTHALLQEWVSFHALGFAIIDEQHKFGVKQRSWLQAHGSPHLLQMTATPIPRSLALAYFGEFEVSTIDEMPPWRKPIHTTIISTSERKKLKPWIMTKISQWQKVFVITPLIEQSEHLDEVASAQQEFLDVCALYPEIEDKVWLLHGKMKPKEKDDVMRAFKDGRYCFLVSTTVIEVGIDVPDATVMIIKNAERFGLSQLHQLRGRVWRSSLQSYCFLQTAHKSWDTYTRLRHMENTHDGFALAAIDLQLRGAGEILWMRQSGETDLPVDLLLDMEFLSRVRQAGEWLLDTYPHLESLELLNSQLQEKMDSILV
jgi:ATP-dependent DNA helicase RecG